MIMLAVVAIAILVLAPTLHTYFTQRQHIQDLQHQLEAKRAQVDDVRAQSARWDDPSYVRAQARERLLYVMPGETSYLVIDDLSKEATNEDLPVSDDVQKAPRDWVGNIASSLVSSGLTTVPIKGGG